MKLLKLYIKLKFKNSKDNVCLCYSSVCDGQWCQTTPSYIYSYLLGHIIPEFILYLNAHTQIHTHTHNRFTSHSPGPPGWTVARRKLLDFMVQGKINRGRHNNNPARRHSIQTNQCHCPRPPSPIFYSARNARIASAVLATAIPSIRLSVCLSVRLSHAGIVSKRRHVARCSFHRWIAKCV